MTLHFLDMLPIDEGEYFRRENRQLSKENQELKKENQQLKQQNADFRTRLQQKDAQINELRVELDKFYKMTPKEFKKFYKERQQAQQTSENQNSNVATPFSSLLSENSIDLSQSNQATTTEHTVAAAGLGYDGGTSSNLLSSIVIVGVSLCLCFLGAMAYRKHEKK